MTVGAAPTRRPSPRARHAVQLADSLVSGPASADRAPFDALVSRAREELGSQWAAFSLLSDRQVIISAAGWGENGPDAGTGIDYDDTICVTMLRTESELAIPDTTLDERMSSIPVVRAGAVRSYLGVPVRVGDAIVGAVCVTDPAPREWTDTDHAALRSVATDLGTELSRVEA